MLRSPQFHLALFSLTAVLFFLGYFYLDRTIATYICHAGETIHCIGKTLSYFGESTWPIVLALLVMIYSRFIQQSSQRFKQAFYILLSIIASGLLTNVLKFIFGRMRPWLLRDDNLYGFTWFAYDTPLVSFPSGHSTTSVALAVALALLFPTYRWLFALFALLMLVARILACDHFFSDVMVGAYIGAITSILLYHIYYISNKNYKGA